MLCLHKCRFHWPSHSEITQQVVGIVQSATTTTMRLGRLKEIDFRNGWVEGSPSCNILSPRFPVSKPAPACQCFHMFTAEIRQSKAFFSFFSIVFLNFLVIVSLELREDQLQQMWDSSPDTYLSRKKKWTSALQTTKDKQFWYLFWVVAKI